MPRQQLLAELLFQLLDLAAQGRLRDMQLFRRSADMPLLCNRSKIAKLPQFHGLASSAGVVLDAKLALQIHMPTVLDWQSLMRLVLDQDQIARPENTRGLAELKLER